MALMIELPVEAHNERNANCLKIFSSVATMNFVNSLVVVIKLITSLKNNISSSGMQICAVVSSCNLITKITQVQIQVKSTNNESCACLSSETEMRLICRDHAGNIVCVCDIMQKSNPGVLMYSTWCILTHKNCL